MVNLDSFSESSSVKDLGLIPQVYEVYLADAQSSKLFKRPIELYEKWCAMPDDVPHYNNIDPVKIGTKILPTLFILDVIAKKDKPLDFRWRLFGTLNRQRYGIEATGFLLSKALHLDASIAESLRLSRLVCETKQPRFMATSFMKGDACIYQASSVIMPLSDDGGNTARLFGCTDWH